MDNSVFQEPHEKGSDEWYSVKESPIFAIRKRLPLFSGRVAPLANRWQVIWYFNRDIRTMESGWKTLDIGILKITSVPPPGVLLMKQNYKGFLLKLRLFIPIEIE